MNNTAYTIIASLLCFTAIVLITLGYYTVASTFKPDPTIFQTLKASCNDSTKIVKHTDNGVNITLDCDTGLITYFHKR